MSHCSTSYIRFLLPRLAAALLLAALPALGAKKKADQPIVIDASAPAVMPRPVQAALGTSTAANGNTLTVNSQYLLLNGQPWLPVMGEFHYSRVPEEQWEEEILKMKEAGVKIVSTYVIWIHHEEVEGQFDWSGQRDLRHFVELCGKHGMYVYPRIGPWAHGEVRNGGLPDWVLRRSAVRRNDPEYLAEVKIFYDQIGNQLRGLLWKDNGPVIGIQLENEYRGSGAGSGDEHIRRLKQLAQDAGLDVPLYTVTGWDGAAVPLDQVLPVFGGYPDAPWSRTPGKLPVNEVFSFRFKNRAAGNMGAMGSGGQNGAAAYRGTPFLTAEVGGGMADTYYRRPVIHADDIASLAPVMLGSGANLLGYYMFQGGRNPDGKLTALQESQRTGYPTDVPVKSYDFQAPLSEFGEERESFRRMKLVNYFLGDFGAMLAPMQVAAPMQLPATPQDLTVTRVSARTSGNHGFLFFNNYVRGASMPERKAFQIRLTLPSGELRIPDRPIDLPSGAYGIWPVNFDLGGVRLIYTTAQLFKSATKAGERFYFFFAVPGVATEFAFPSKEKFLSDGSGRGDDRLSTRDGVTYVRMDETPGIRQIAVSSPLGPVHIVLMPRSMAEDLWTVDDSTSLIRTSAQVFSDHRSVFLRSIADSEFSFGVFGTQRPRGLKGQNHGVFTDYAIRIAPVKMEIDTSLQHAAQPPSGSPADQPIPFAPEDGNFEKAAVWDLKIPARWSPEVSNVFLQIAYTGDVARLYADNRLLDDNFWNGSPWRIGLKQWRGLVQTKTLQLRILPAAGDRSLGDDGESNERARRGARLVQVEILPEYQTTVDLNP